MSGWTTCPECAGEMPSGQQYGHCAACHTTFMGGTAFDKHRRGRHPDRTCIDPATDDALTETGRPVAQWWADDRGRWHEGARDPRFETKETQ